MSSNSAAPGAAARGRKPAPPPVVPDALPVLPPPEPPVSAVAALPREAGFIPSLAAWMIDRHAPGSGVLDAPAIDAVVGRLRLALCLSNHERDGCRALLTQVARARAGWAAAPTAARKRLALRPRFGQTLWMLDALDPPLAASIRADLAEWGIQAMTEPPPPLLKGDHLIAMGFRPGPRFKVILGVVYDAQLEGRVADLDAARDLARGLWDSTAPWPKADDEQWM